MTALSEAVMHAQACKGSGLTIDEANAAHTAATWTEHQLSLDHVYVVSCVIGNDEHLLSVWRTWDDAMAEARFQKAGHENTREVYGFVTGDVYLESNDDHLIVVGKKPVR